MVQQQSFTEALKGWEGFLSKSARRYIRIKDLRQMKYVAKEGSGEMPSRFFMVDVLKDSSSLEDWFNGLMLANDLENFTIYFKVLAGSNGTANVPGFPERTYNVTKRLQMLRERGPETPAPVQQPVKTETMQHNIQPHVQYQPSYPQVANGLGASVMQAGGGVMAAAHAAGLGLSDFIDLKKNADKASEYKIELDKLRSENERLITDNRDLKSQVQHAERDKELSLKLAKLEKSGFMDSEAGQKILASAPEIIAMMMQQKNGQQSQAQIGMGSPQGLSEPKQRLVEFVSDNSVPDAVAELLEQVLALLSQHPTYSKELRALNQKIQGNVNSNG